MKRGMKGKRKLPRTALRALGAEGRTLMRYADRVTPNQVFIGCPWHNYRDKYDRITHELQRVSPLAFVMVGRGDGQEAEDLLHMIRERLLASSHAIFDATGGNANVSLEYGMAEEAGVPCTLYLHVHARASRTIRDSPIIADLAGKRRHQYKQEKGLKKLLREFAAAHAYSKRFEAFVRREFRAAGRTQKRRLRILALRMIHALDSKQSLRRSDLLDGLLVEYKEKSVAWMLRILHKAGLLRVTRGRYSEVTLR